MVFRIQLLPPSETFIVAQAVAMRRFTPFFVGWRKMAGIDLPENKSWTVDDGGLRGKLRELRFRYRVLRASRLRGCGPALPASFMRTSRQMVTRRCNSQKNSACHWSRHCTGMT